MKAKKRKKVGAPNPTTQYPNRHLILRSNILQLTRLVKRPKAFKFLVKWKIGILLNKSKKK